MTIKIGRQLVPSHAHFFQKSPDQNFEILILFHRVKKSNNYVFEDNLIPSQYPGEGLQVINFDQSLHTALVIGKYTDIFMGDISGGRG